MGLPKDYDYTIEYHLGKANAMANTPSKKAINSLAYVQTIYYHLLPTLKKMGVKLDMNYYRALLMSFQVQHLLIN